MRKILIFSYLYFASWSVSLASEMYFSEINVTQNTSNNDISNKIVGAWGGAVIEDGLEIKCRLAFNTLQKVKIKLWAEGFEPNVGSYTVIIDEEGGYKIHGNTLITNWDNNTAKVTISDLQYTDAMADLIKEHPGIEVKIQETIKNLLEQSIKDVANDMDLLNNKTTIQSVTDKELAISGSKKTIILIKEE